MKKIYVIVLLTLILAQFSIKTCIYIFFYFNQQKIAQTICVNKLVKNNSCNGKCYLNKLISSPEKNHQPFNQSNLLNIKTETNYLHHHLHYNYTPSSLYNHSEIFYTKHFTCRLFIYEFFNPPKSTLYKA